MTITQTVDIPASYRLTIDVPREIPVGRTVIAFTPAPESECPLCAKYRDPETGELRLNAETLAGMQEVEDMISGKIPATWHKSLDDLDEMLGL
ncbi:MAG: hypothetical protein LBH44_13620 [Treponema sp.]|jgi:hypothetical protein|nr:hypothetical protein [Treponema sp.]